MAHWYLVNYKGRIGVTMGWSSYGQKEPVETRDVWVHPTEKWDEDYYSQFTQVTFVGNEYFNCFSSRTYNVTPLYTIGWVHEIEEREVKRPGRGGKDWSWRWSDWSYKWVKTAC